MSSNDKLCSTRHPHLTNFSDSGKWRIAASTPLTTLAWAAFSPQSIVFVDTEPASGMTKLIRANKARNCTSRVEGWCAIAANTASNPSRASSASFC